MVGGWGGSWSPFLLTMLLSLVRDTESHTVLGSLAVYTNSGIVLKNKADITFTRGGLDISVYLRLF